MKSNTSFTLFAVCLFGLIVSLNSSPMVPDGGETSGTSDNLRKSIRNYIINILTYNKREGLSRAEYNFVIDPDFLKKLDSVKDNSFISDYLKFLLDPEFILRAIEAWDEVRLGIEEGNSENRNKEACAILLDITKKKINEKKGNNELKTLEFYVRNDEELYVLITFFMEDVKL